MHQTISYFDRYIPLVLWLSALWFWIPEFRFQVESNNSWEIQLDGILPVIDLLLFLQVLRPPWTIHGRITQSLGIGRCRISLLWVLQEACIPVIWREMMLSIALFLPRTGSYSTRVILGNMSGTWFDTIVSWVHRYIPRQDSGWIVAFRMNIHVSHTSSQPSGIRSFWQLVPSCHHRRAYPLLHTSGRPDKPLQLVMTVCFPLDRVSFYK